MGYGTFLKTLFNTLVSALNYTQRLVYPTEKFFGWMDPLENAVLVHQLLEINNILLSWPHLLFEQSLEGVVS